VGGQGVGQIVAALYVDPRGTYSQVPDVELWDEARDARKYAGPYPVVAHPPCARWGKLALLTERMYGLRRGDDGGCFIAALTAVRLFGGVLEHPAYSNAWRTFGLIAPNARGGWQQTLDGAWVCHVEQGHYGHVAPKATWIYAFRCGELLDFKWGRCEHEHGRKRIGNVGKRGGAGGALSNSAMGWATRHERRTTPPAFRDLLLSMARSCYARRTT
jgi:hypothetical protein